MIRLDGSLGEGGGQILRTALALSTITGQPFEMINIRSRRPRPGLRPQHLEAVKAAARIASAEVAGAVENSSELRFEPGPVTTGRFRFEIRTAGSSSLVLQTITLPLALAGGGSRVEIRGGTHVAWSPCYHYLERQWAPALERLGIRVRLELKRAGFYPEGGGEIQAQIDAPGALTGMRCTERGRLTQLTLLSAACHLPSHIAERQCKRVLSRIEKMGLEPRVELAENIPAHGKGSFLILTAQYEKGAACYSALGARGKPAEKVGDEAARPLMRYIEGEAAFDEYLADQILLPLSVIPHESEYTTVCVTDHLLTNAEVIRRFVDAEIRIEGARGEPGRVRVRGCDVRVHGKSSSA